MLRINKNLVIIALSGAIISGLTGCAGIGTTIVDLGTTTGGAGQGAQQIDSAQRAAIGESLNNTYMKLTTSYATEGIYTAIVDPNGIVMVVSDSGFILKGSTINGATAYRVNDSTKLYWFDQPAIDINELAAAGAIIPSGITTLP